MFLIAWVAWTPLREILDPRVRLMPAPQTERTYFLQTRATMPPSKGTRDMTVSSELVVRHSVREDDDGIVIRGEPLYLSIDGGQSSRDRVSSLDDSSGQQKLRELLAPGMDVVLDEDGRTIDVRPVAQQAWDAADPEQTFLRSLLGDQFGPAGFAMVDLRARVGATVQMPAQDPIPALQLEVIAVSDEHVLIDIANVDGDMRVTGRMNVERESGWLDGLALVVEGDLTGQASQTQGPVVTRLLMRRADDAAYGALEQVTESHQHLPPPESFGHPLPRNKTFDEVLDGDMHVFGIGRSGVRLAMKGLMHDDEAYPARISVSDVTAYDEHGEPLDLAFLSVGEQVSSFTAAATEYQLIPLTWDHDVLSRIERLQGRVHYHDQDKPEPVVLPLRAEATELRAGGARAMAQPADEPGEWDITLQSGGGFWYSLDYLGSAPDGDWYDLSTMPGSDVDRLDATVLRLVQDKGMDAIGNMIFRYRPQNAEAGLPLARWSPPADTPSREVKWVTPEARFAMVELPVPKLFMSAAGAALAEPRAWSWQDFAPEGIDRNELRLTLPPSIAQKCTLSSDAPPEEGTPLVWQQSEPAPQRRQMFGGNDDAPAPGDRTYQLKTKDGIRSVFYGIDVTVQLVCPGMPTWQEVTLEEQFRPWLVPIAALQQQDNALAQDAAFPSTVRARDEDGAIMRPLPNALDKLVTPETDLTLDDYLYDGQLRYVRPVVSIERLTFEGAPVTREWAVQLEALP